MFAQEPVELDWVHAIGGIDFDQGYSVTTDPKGNILIMGSFAESIDLAPGPDTLILRNTQRSRSLYICKMDFSGKPIWARQIENMPYITPTPDFSPDNQLVSDNRGNVYVTGRFSEPIDIDAGPNTLSFTPKGAKDLFVLKLDENGNFLWAHQLGGNNATLERPSISVDTRGNVFTCGTLRGTVDFDPGSGTQILSSNGQNRALFIQKLHTNGMFLWANVLKNDQDINFHSTGTDGEGNFLITGTFLDSVDVDPGQGIVTLRSPFQNKSSLFLLKLGVLGNFVWAHQATGDQGTGESYITTDAANNVYLGGRFSGSMDLDPGPDSLVIEAEENGVQGTFFQKLTSRGSYLWGGQITYRRSSSSPFLTLKEVEGDASGNFYLRGEFSGTVDFDLGPDSMLIDASNDMNNAIISNTYIAKYNSQGMLQWVRQIEAFDLPVSDMAVDPNSDILFTGTISAIGADFDPGPNSRILTSEHGLEDLFLGKWTQGNPCSSLDLEIDKSVDITCSPGLLSGFARGGTPPYSYQWNSNRALTDTFLQVSSSGIYDLLVTDSLGCLRNVGAFVSAPDNFNRSDLRINTTAAEFRSGFEAHIWLDAYNDGCIPVDGIITLQLDPLLIYQGATIRPDTIIDNTLLWNVENMTLDSPHVKIRVDVEVSRESRRGDRLCVRTNITPKNVLTFRSRNNQDEICKTVVASFDPNDKRGNPEGLCEEGFIMADELITYTVRFQNVGDVEAINIFILDTLDADLEIDSLKIVGTSHQPMITEVLPGNILKFRFDGINLPDSTNDEPNSHGYVMFEIAPIANIPLGTELVNRAGIYFDFNDPVITNAVLNTLVASLPTQDTTFLQAEACGNYELNRRSYANSGTFIQHLPGMGSCDSIVSLELMITQPDLDTSVSVSGITLTSNQVSDAGSPVTYQWIDCDNNLPISGATDQAFTPEQNGNYAVIINKKGCSQSSACINVSSVGIDPEFLESISYYPNPSTGLLIVDLGVPYPSVQVDVFSISGQLLETISYGPGNKVSLQLPEQKGFYLVKVQAGNQHAFLKILKE